MYFLRTWIFNCTQASKSENFNINKCYYLNQNSYSNVIHFFQLYLWQLFSPDSGRNLRSPSAFSCPFSLVSHNLEQFNSSVFLRDFLWYVLTIQVLAEKNERGWHILPIVSYQKAYHVLWLHNFDHLVKVKKKFFLAL